MKLQSVKSELIKLFMLLVAAFVSFTSLYVFVIPSNFSPNGIDGISTILYEITGINIGWFKIAFNIPLLILAWIYLKKRYVVYVVLFTMLDSFGVIVLEEINFFTFIPAGLSDADAVGYRLIAAIFAGVALGIATFMNTMKQHPDTFVYFSDGVKVQGDFHFGENIGGRINAY